MSDDPASLIVRMLTALGFEVVEAVDGRQGIEEFTANPSEDRILMMAHTASATVNDLCDFLSDPQ